MNVSVIIPVYNPGDALVANLECMIRQEGDDREFIYINDGSTDDSKEILERYRRKDSRIKIINQDNKGPSEARNQGIMCATGEIIMFVDSDDYIADGSIDYIKSAMKQYKLDVFLGAEIAVFPNQKVETSQEKTIEQPFVETGMNMLLEARNSFTNCLYTYNREFLLTNHLFFEPGIIHEDMDYIPKALRVANRVMKTTYRYYYHVYRDNSITHRRNLARSKDLIYIANKWKEESMRRMMNLQEKVFFTNYSAWLCSQAIHVAILNGFPINDIFLNKDERTDVIHILQDGNWSCNVISLVLRCHLDDMYAKVYQMFKGGYARTGGLERE